MTAELTVLKRYQITLFMFRWSSKPRNPDIAARVETSPAGRSTTTIDPKAFFTANDPTLPNNDDTDYLHTQHELTPRAILTFGILDFQGQLNPKTRSTSAGVLLRKGHLTRLSVANHGFLDTNEVRHPNETSRVIGTITDRYPAIDVALVELNALSEPWATNKTYFEAEPPKKLLKGNDIRSGMWAEVDGMSSGMFYLNFLVTYASAPERPPNHPNINHSQWTVDKAAKIFGATNLEMQNGTCGAPIVTISTANMAGGGVAGFFHRAHGDFAVSATLDDLIAEGWEIKLR
ncbi:MAG: hypothetical protein Q9213_007724 [Squamulea squamosa]